MKMKILTKIKMILVACVIIPSLQLFAGADHDHGAPTFQPPKGGVLQSTHDFHFELVKKGKMIFLYAYDQEGKSVPTNKFKISTQLEVPRQKTTSLKFADKGTNWETELNLPNTHRFTVLIKVDDGKEKDDVKFTFENK